MKRIEVVAGIICADAFGNLGKPHSADIRYFATQRGYGEQKGGWEFPGGKMEPGETPQQALARAELHTVNWLPADIKVVKAIESIS